MSDLSIFAQDAPTMIGAAYVIGGAVILAAGAGILAWLNNGKRLMDQQAALQAHYSQQETRLNLRIDELTGLIFKLQDANTDCRKADAEKTVQIAAQQAEIKQLLLWKSKIEKDSGIFPDTVAPRYGTVIADLNGIIRTFPPSLTVLFKWEAKEVLGKSVEILMADDVAPIHHAAFAKLKEGGMLVLDPTKTILSYGKDRFGVKFPVAISLDGYKDGDRGAIMATIRERTTTEIDVDPSLSGVHKILSGGTSTGSV